MPSKSHTCRSKPISHVFLINCFVCTYHLYLTCNARSYGNLAVLTKKIAQRNFVFGRLFRRQMNTWTIKWIQIWKIITTIFSKHKQKAVWFSDYIRSHNFIYKCFECQQNDPPNHNGTTWPVTKPSLFVYRLCRRNMEADQLQSPLLTRWQHLHIRDQTEGSDVSTKADLLRNLLSQVQSSRALGW